MAQCLIGTRIIWIISRTPGRPLGTCDAVGDPAMKTLSPQPPWNYCVELRDLGDCRGSLAFFWSCTFCLVCWQLIWKAFWLREHEHENDQSLLHYDNSLLVLPQSTINYDKVRVKKKMRHFQKLGFSEKSTIFVLPSRNLLKMITSWGNDFHQVSWG